MKFLGTQVDIVPVRDPVSALASLAGEVEALRSIIREKLAETETTGMTGQVTALVQLYTMTIERAERLLTTLAKLDPDNREMSIHNRQMRAVVVAVMMTVESLGVRASEQQVNALMAQNLRAARVEIEG